MGICSCYIMEGRIQNCNHNMVLTLYNYVHTKTNWERVQNINSGRISCHLIFFLIVVHIFKILNIIYLKL